MSNPPPPPGTPSSPPGAWVPPPTPSEPGWGATAPVAGWGAGPAAQRPPVKVTSRFGEGILVGLAASATAGALWWAIVALTERQFFYGAIAVGLIVGQGVLIGARRGGPVAGLLAATFTLASLVVAEYFIQRSLAISQSGFDVPLWTDLTFAKDVVREGLKAQPAIGIFWGIAAIAALATAGIPNRRPSI